jgi:hypothetical protein
MSYSYYRSCTTTFSQCGTVSSANFPVLVYISAISIKTAANGGHVNNTVTQSGGNAITIPADLVFSTDNAGASPLPWEVDTYDPVNGILWAWVQVPTLSVSVATTFYCVYGQSSVTTQQNTGLYAPSAVWDSHYLAVWHLSNITGGLVDSTSHGRTLTNSGMSNATGQIGGGISNTTTAQYASLATAPNPSNITVESWAKTTNVAGSPTIAEVQPSGSLGSNSNWQLGLSISGGTHPRFCVVNGTTFNSVTSTVTVANGTWYHVVGTYDGGHDIIYVNGVATSVVLSVTMNTFTVLMTIGDFSTGTQTPTAGTIDELRLSDTARPSSWVTASYNNQTNPSSFLTVGIEVAAAIAWTQTITAAMATCAGAINNATSKALSSTMATMAGAMANQTSKAVTATMATCAGAVSATKVKLIAIAATMATFAGAVSKSISKGIGSSMATMAGAVTKKASKSLSATMATFSGTIARTFLRSLTASMATMAGLVKRATMKGIQGTTAQMAGATSKATAKSINATLSTMHATATKAINKALSAVMAGFAALFTSVKRGVFRPQPGRILYVASDRRTLLVNSDTRTIIVPEGDQ